MAKDEENKKEKLDYEVGIASLNNFADFSEGASLLDLATPNDRYKKIEKAREYVWGSGLLFRMIKLKVEFASAGFEITHENEDVEKFYKDIYEELDIEKFIRSAAFEHEVIGEWYPLYSWEDGKPIHATLLNPQKVEVKSALGKDFIYLYPSGDIEVLLQDDDPEIKKELKKIVPLKILNKWERGLPARLSKEYSKRYVNLKAPFEKYAHSPIEPIFPDLEILKTLQEADYATAKKFKQLLLQVKIGDSKLNDGGAVPTPLIKQTRELWNNPSETMEIFTQWFVEAEYITPDLDIFNNEKYEAVLKRIIDWSGMNVMIGDGGSYSGGYIKVKGLKQSVENIREVIRKALDDLNKIIAEKNNLKYYGELKTPDIKFNNNALKDDKEIRKIVQFLYKHGLLSGEDTLDNFDYDFDRQMGKKEDEQEYSDVIKIDFEPSQGLLGDEEISNKDNPKDDEQPRP